MNKAAFFVAILAVIVSSAHAGEQVIEESAWTDTYPVSAASPRLEISNIWGSVRVRSGEPGQITVSVKERRAAPDQELFERSLDVIKADSTADAAGVSILVGEPIRGWQRLDRCPGCRVDYQFDVTVPPGTTVDVGTVLDGRVEVEDVNGAVSASNVNGPISVAGLSDCESIHSVNGRISLDFRSAPGRDCAIETINGDITLGMPNGSGLDIALDLFNGRIVSELQVDPIALPATVEHTTDGDPLRRVRNPGRLDDQRGHAPALRVTGGVQRRPSGAPAPHSAGLGRRGVRRARWSRRPRRARAAESTTPR